MNIIDFLCFPWYSQDFSNVYILQSGSFGNFQAIVSKDTASVSFHQAETALEWGISLMPQYNHRPVVSI